MSEPVSDRIVFFERSDSYRRWPYLLICLIFGGAGLAGLVLGIAQVFREGLANLPAPGVIFGTVWITAMLGIGSYLGYRIIFRPGWPSRVDSDGITADSRHWPWSEVKRVFAKRDAAGVWLCFQSKGFSPDRGIHGLPRLTAEEAEEFFEALESYLQEQHPHVAVG